MDGIVYGDIKNTRSSPYSRMKSFLSPSLSTPQPSRPLYGREISPSCLNAGANIFFSRVLDSLREMIDGHLALRQALRREVPNISEILDEHDRPEEGYQCAVCKGFSYLAQVTCDCTKQVSCLEHWTSLCACPYTSRILRPRFDDEQLLSILAKVEERSTAPQTWRKRLRDALSTPSPDLADLRELVTDAEDMAVPLDEYPNLKKFVDQAEVYAGAAKKIVEWRQVPAHKKVLPRKHPLDATSNNLYAVNGQFSVEDIRKIVREAASLGFQGDEVSKLSNVALWAETWDSRARTMLDEAKALGSNAPYDRAAWDSIFAEAFSHNVLLLNLKDVEDFIRRNRLIEELKGISEIALMLDDVRELQRQAKLCGLPPDQEQAMKLQKWVERGEVWHTCALRCLESPKRSLEDLNNLVSPHAGVPVVHSLLERIDAVRSRAREVEKQMEKLVAPPVGRRTPIVDAQRLVDLARNEFIMPAVDVAYAAVSTASLYEKNSAEILTSRYQPTRPLFEELREMRTNVQRRFWMFAMPHYEEVDRQLVRHDSWLEKLPWYRTPEPAMQGKLIVDDVYNTTRPEDDKPPTDNECTCICPSPVRVVVERLRQSEAVQCDHCGAKFHAKCIEGSCPFCDHHHWNGAMLKSRNFQYTDLLPIAREAPDLTRNYSLAWKHLDIIITSVDRLIRSMDGFLMIVSEPASPMPLPTAIAQIRHFLRKLYKIQFAIKARPDLPSYGLTLCHLHRSLATTRSMDGSVAAAAAKKKGARRPRFVFSAEVAPQAKDKTRCLCLGSHTGHRKVVCTACSVEYHGYCVRYDDINNPSQKPWRCPICLVRKGKKYPQSAVRVRCKGSSPFIRLHSKPG